MNGELSAECTKEHGLWQLLLSSRDSQSGGVEIGVLRSEGIGVRQVGECPRRRIAAYSWVAVFALAGCFNEAGPPRDMPSAELDCAASIDKIAAPPEGYHSVLGVTALPDPDTQHQLGRTDPTSGLRFTKMGLLVRAEEEEALITIDPGQAEKIRIDWGTIAAGEPPSPPPFEQIVVPRCESDSAWLVYAGGIWVGDAACVGLTVSSGDRSESIRLPIDTHCP